MKTLIPLVLLSVLSLYVAGCECGGGIGNGSQCENLSLPAGDGGDDDDMDGSVFFERSLFESSSQLYTVQHYSELNPHSDPAYDVHFTDSDLDPDSPFQTGSHITISILDAGGTILSEVDLGLWLDGNANCPTGWTPASIPNEIGRICTVINESDHLVQEFYMVTGTDEIVKMEIHLWNPSSPYNTIKYISPSFKSLSL